jgi:hypothetical protein
LCGGIAGIEQFQVLVVDERLAFGVTRQADVFGLLADDDVDGPF